ncbi:MAG: hypothetical protein HYY06_16810 [Deltaproteobacteria bacterium]|nr:hypothetical protein [Deltaproteobacteria bacterium]
MADLSPADRALLDRIARKVVDKGMSAPAIFFLESIKPLNFVASQAMIFFGPILTSIFSRSDYDRLATILEDRGSIEELLTRIEALEAGES